MEKSAPRHTGTTMRACLDGNALGARPMPARSSGRATHLLQRVRARLLAMGWRYATTPYPKPSMVEVPSPCGLSFLAVHIVLVQGPDSPQRQYEGDECQHQDVVWGDHQHGFVLDDGHRRELNDTDPARDKR